jgi:glycosyltransferase involved in cell wall biosynthesis
MTGRRPVDEVRLAFVHDWLTGMRGGEKVLEALCARWPRADVYTLVHVPGRVTPVIDRRRIRQSFVGRLPGMGAAYRFALPLFPVAVELFDLDGYDLVVSTSHCAVKSVVTAGRTRHLCYCFTPMRYAWDQFDAYFGEARLGPVSRPMRLVLARLARWDAATSGRPQRYVAISQYVAERIRRYYNRRSVVVHPPVDTDFFSPAAVTPEPFALVVAALVPYKRVDLAIEACRIAGIPLKIVGHGPERSRLERLGGPGVEFLGSLADAEVRDLYRRARAVLLPGEEDFGLVPVEAQACGRPVVALNRGGARETVIDGVTGVLVDEPTAEALAGGLARLEGLALDPRAIRAHALSFSRDRFLAAMESMMEDLVNAPAEAVRW